MAETISFTEWYDKAYDSDMSLTIEDVLSMGNGEAIPILPLHRNFGDDVCNLHKKEKMNDAKAASVHLRSLCAYFVHNKELSGYIKWPWDEDGKHETPFNLDLEFKHGHWYPISRRGNIIGRASYHGKRQGFRELLPAKPKHWTEYPVTTRVGWRGPMIPWMKIDRLPPFKVVPEDEIG